MKKGNPGLFAGRKPARESPQPFVQTKGHGSPSSRCVARGFLKGNAALRQARPALDMLTNHNIDEMTRLLGERVMDRMVV